MRGRIEESIDRLAMLEGVARLGVAFSGGADSTLLIHMLAEIVRDRRIELRALHLNHGLRGADSDSDEQFVRHVCLSLGVELETRRTAVAETARENRWSLEDAGRRARYEFFQDAIEQGRVDVVATGHHKNDQAETVLFRLLRGGGVAALAGVRANRRPGIVRPLLGLARLEIEQELERRRIPWRRDSSNTELGPARNRIRAELLPQLEREWNPRLIDALARNAALAADEEEYWEREIERLLPRVSSRDRAGIVLDLAELQALHPAVQRRVWRAALSEARGYGDGPSSQHSGAQHVESLMRLAEARSGSGSVDLPGAVAERSFGEIRVRSAGRPDAAGLEQAAIDPPAEIEAPDRRTRIRLESLDVSAQIGGYTNPYRCRLAWDRLPGRVFLRSWRPGDRFCARIGDRDRKVKEMFQRARIASWDRAGWPVLVAGEGSAETLVWLRGFGAAERFVAGPGERNTVGLAETNGAGRQISGIEDCSTYVFRERGFASPTEGTLS